MFEPSDVDAAPPEWSRKLKKVTRMDYETAKTVHKFFDAGAPSRSEEASTNARR